MAKLIPNDFKGKVIINFEEIDNISDSFVCLKEDHDSILEVDLISSCHVKLNTIDNKVNNAYDIDYEVPKQEGRSLAIFTAVDIPYVARHNVPESKVDLVEVAKIINIYVVIYQGSCIELKKKIIRYLILTVHSDLSSWISLSLIDLFPVIPIRMI
ncbi:TPA: hypothetical protein ACXE9F_002523 [Pluralibacter gergoviae]